MAGDAVSVVDASERHFAASIAQARAGDVIDVDLDQIRAQLDAQMDR